MQKYLMYLRKSRADGEHETIEEILARHEKILQEYAEKNIGKAVPEEDIFREIVSGETIKDRPLMNKLLKCIQNEQITGVLVIRTAKTQQRRLTRLRYYNKSFSIYKHTGLYTY